MNRKKLNAVVSLLILLPLQMLAQQYFVKSFSPENGLPTRIINDVCQDTSGTMWFATNFGISAYDGLGFDNYDFQHGLPNQVYRKIKIDQKGILWVLPEMLNDTLVYRENNTWKRIPLPSAENKKQIVLTSFDILYKNNQVEICVGSQDGFYIFKNNKWAHFNISTKKDFTYVFSVESKNRSFYLATKEGIVVYTDGKLDMSLNKLIVNKPASLISLKFQDKNTPNEKLWLLNEKWTGYIQNKRFTLVTDKFQLTEPLIFYYSFIDCDKNGNLFFGNIWGKYYIPAKSSVPRPLMLANGFSSDGATSVFIDREQNVWFTDTRGINKLNNHKIFSYFERNGILEDEVSAIAELPDRRILLGHNKGLSIIGENGIIKIPFPKQELSAKRVLTIIRDQEGHTRFVSNSLGIGQLNSNNTISWIKNPFSASTSEMLQDRNGRIWIASERKLFYLNGNKFVEFAGYTGTNSTIRRLFNAPDGGIYIAGINGLWLLKHDKLSRIPSPPDKKGDNVFSYFRDNKGIEFVGTLHGLYVIDKGKLVKYNKFGIEINNPVFFIFQDNRGFYWIGSNNGVYRWDGGNQILIYNIYNGLAGWETNRGAGMQDSKGRIWIGTDRGLTCFQPTYDSRQIPIPTIRLLSVEDRTTTQYPLSQKSNIRYSDNTLIFHFRGISFFNEDIMQYRYKLEGFDESWQYITQPMLSKVKYIGLKPGEYRLSVSAHNFSGAWSPVVKSEVIRIMPPYYLTWWFIFTCLMLSAGIIYGIIRINVQRSHNTKLEAEIDERKRVELALSQSRQKYLDLVELLPETVFESDLNGELVYLNDSGFRLFGYENQTIIHPLNLHRLVASSDLEQLNHHLLQVYTSGVPNKTVLGCIRNEGTIFPVSIHTAPILFNNNILGYRGIIIDLTEQKRFESQLQKNAEDLAALNSSKDKFFSIIAHDLRSPFTSFLGFTEMLDEEIDILPKEELQTIISSMRKSASNLYQLLENLLEWSLLHREITKFEPLHTYLKPLVEGCIEVMNESVKKKNLILQVDIGILLKVNADIHMLQTIIRNLVSNAIKFTPRGGKIKISAIAGPETFVTISVSDTGIGMSPEIAETIFKIDTNNKTKGTEGEPSTGLGLILCKEFVEKHGGKIWVESKENEGSIFYFTINSM